LVHFCGLLGYFVVFCYTYFEVFWQNLWSFGKICGLLAKFVVFWYILWSFGVFWYVVTRAIWQPFFACLPRFFSAKLLPTRFPQPMYDFPSFCFLQQIVKHFRATRRPTAVSTIMNFGPTFNSPHCLNFAFVWVEWPYFLPASRGQCYDFRNSFAKELEKEF
jgi:hypothetical protein